MRIYLIRHADPDYPTDSLTPAGHLEAKALAAHLAEIGIDEIYSSPRGRARLTAQAVADQTHLPVTIEPWAAELDGIYSSEHGHNMWDLNGAVLRGPEVMTNLNHWEGFPPLNHPRLAEHLRNIRAGSEDFLKRQGFTRDGLAYHFAQPNRKRIAFIAHLGFGFTWLADLLAIPVPLMWAGFYIHPSSVTTILFDERSPGMAVPRVLGLGDISHLIKAGLPPTPSGIIANYD